MIVTIEGVITSKERIEKIKDNKTVVSTELLLAQPGEKVQTAVRLDGDMTGNYELFEVNVFKGQLLAWRTRDSVGMMVIVREAN
ncbi:hypothetical protein UY416_25550 [Paenibacillus polymyxa]|uniref:hypothetical protein n=1 Tax=Paenibacillus polymyxa TaxID=1406 RepID=UPI002AB37140|nr:hypothetical protein [Paenibacillus polymyxa]MDY8049659.1 hypothetical protein [Paenibacillus polymyxa]